MLIVSYIDLVKIYESESRNRRPTSDAAESLHHKKQFCPRVPRQSGEQSLRLRGVFFRLLRPVLLQGTAALDAGNKDGQ